MFSSSGLDFAAPSLRCRCIRGCGEYQKERCSLGLLLGRAGMSLRHLELISATGDDVSTFRFWGVGQVVSFARVIRGGG